MGEEERTEGRRKGGRRVFYILASSFSIPQRTNEVYRAEEGGRSQQPSQRRIEKGKGSRKRKGKAKKR